MNSNCTRTPRCLALFMTMFLFLAKLTYACPRDRLFHVKDLAPCKKDCIYLHILADRITAEFISRPQTLSQWVVVNRPVLAPKVLKGQQPLIPLRPQRLVDSRAGLPGCRYCRLQRGIQQGSRPSDQVPILLNQWLGGALQILTLKDQTAFGVYDVNSLMLIDP